MDGENDQAPWPNDLQNGSAVKSRRNLEPSIDGFVNDLNTIHTVPPTSRINNSIENLVYVSEMDSPPHAGPCATTQQTITIHAKPILRTSYR